MEITDPLWDFSDRLPTPTKAAAQNNVIFCPRK